MKEKLTKLYNTLSNIETKGENTKLMGVCLQYLEQLIAESSMMQGDTVSETKTESKPTSKNKKAKED